MDSYAEELALIAADALEAQCSVLGSMLIDDRCVGAVMAGLREEDFSDPTCRNTFAAIRALHLEGKPVDPVTIQDRVGGGKTWVSWARDVMSLTPTAANVEEYIRIVLEKARLRRFRALCEQGMACTGMEDARRVCQEASALFVEGGRGRTVTAAELAAEFYTRVTSRERPEYLPWGIPSADRTVYAQPGDVILLGGYPSAGKTLLSVQMALSQAGKYRVVYYTLETQPEKMADRLFAHLAGMPLDAIKERRLTEEQIVRASTAANSFVSNTPIVFVHAAHFTVDDIAADAVSKGAQIIYIDYVQLVEGEGYNDYARVSGVSRALKTFAQTHRTAVVGLAQLSRPEKAGKPGEKKQVPPNMHSFRESGQLEQDADAAFLLWRSDDDDNRSPRVLKLGKNKEGRKFSTVLAFDGPTQTMTDLEVRPDEYFEPHKDESMSVAARFAAQGRAEKNARRAQTSMEQPRFREARTEEKNPFEPEK